MLGRYKTPVLFFSRTGALAEKYARYWKTKKRNGFVYEIEYSNIPKNKVFNSVTYSGVFNKILNQFLDSNETAIVLLDCFDRPSNDFQMDCDDILVLKDFAQIKNIKLIKTI